MEQAHVRCGTKSLLQSLEGGCSGLDTTDLGFGKGREGERGPLTIVRSNIHDDRSRTQTLRSSTDEAVFASGIHVAEVAGAEIALRQMQKVQKVRPKPIGVRSFPDENLRQVTKSGSAHTETLLDERNHCVGMTAPTCERQTPVAMSCR